MKKLLGLIVLLLLGLALGGGAAYGVSRLLGPPPGPEEIAEAEKPETSFVPTGSILTPVVTADGDLSGYVTFDVQLEVPADKAEEVGGKLPLLLHAINLRAWKTPLAAGPNHLLPDVAAFAALVEEAAHSALGKGAVTRAIVTAVKPV